MPRIVATPAEGAPSVWRRAFAAVAATVALALVASACSGSEAATDRETRAASTPAPAAILNPSPLEEALGFSSEPSRRNQTFVTLQRRANESAVQCMRDAGFTYFVEPVSALVFGTRVGDGSRGWVEVNGLGITTRLLELSNLDVSERFDATAANAAYTATLTAEQTVAYDAALIGTGPASVDRATTGFSPDGCWGQAYFGVFEKLTAVSELNADIQVLNLRIEEDPRVTALMDTWSTCMQDRGQRYASRGEMVDDLFARLLSVDFVETATGLEFTDPGVVDELLGIEIVIALDDLDCREDIADPLEVIRRDYERRFVDDNRSRISALGATPQD